MAIRHLITGSVLTLLLLGGCGSVPDTDAGSADAGSAPQQVVVVDPPLDDAAVQDAQAQPLAGVVLCLDPGHGVTDASASERMSPLSQETKPAYVSGAEGDGQTEEELNLAVAELARAGCDDASRSYGDREQSAARQHSE